MASPAVAAAAEPVRTSQHPLGPSFAEKFKPTKARQIIAEVLKTKLTGAAYTADSTSTLTRELADEIKQRLKSEGWPRYKFAVQVFVGEQRGEGCRMACRCFWDSETDSYAFESFKNESLFCTAAAFASYIY
ncbi:Tctex1 domain-containing 2-like protein [Scenedesmus sp. NREL 46B-D3]|nr:Tctex1 domain-containing 2-like protein [Scenedesmus sp. NREL 46B-D3]